MKKSAENMITFEFCRERLETLGVPEHSIQIIDSFIEAILNEDYGLGEDQAPLNIEKRLFCVSVAVSAGVESFAVSEIEFYCQAYFWAHFNQQEETYEQHLNLVRSASSQKEEGLSSPAAGAREGWVYVASNPCMPGLLKIGLTTKSPPERIAQLSKSTSSPAPFQLEWSCMTDDCEYLESALHNIFYEARTPGREFFEVSIQEVVSAAESLGVK